MIQPACTRARIKPFLGIFTPTKCSPLNNYMELCAYKLSLKYLKYICTSRLLKIATFVSAPLFEISVFNIMQVDMKLIAYH